MPGTDENELTECQRPEMADENSASLLAALLSCVSPTHFEVRQLLRHLRPRCLLKKLHRLFWIGSAAVSSSLFTERLAFSAILIALFLHSHVAILPKWLCSELLSPSRPAEELGGSYRKNQRLCIHLPSADRQEHG